MLTRSVQWALTGNSVSQYNISIYALGNTGNSSTITSSSPASTASSSVASSAQASARAAFVDISKRDAINMQVTNQSASTTSTPFIVNLPFGKYYLHGRVNDPTGTSANSGLFWVMEGADMACLSGGATNTSLPVSSAGSSSVTGSETGATGSASAAAGNSSTGDKSGVSGGAIAGIVIGAIAGLVAVALALFYFCYRKKRSTGPEISGPQMASRTGPHFGDRFPGATAMVSGRHRDSQHRTGNTTSSHGHIALTSMSDSSEGHEKDEGPFVGSFGSEVNTPVFLAGYGQTPSSDSPTTPRRDPFATAPNTPMDGGNVSEFGRDATTREERRQSQPATSPIMTTDRTRPNSQPSEGQSGKIVRGGSTGGVKRVPSARRKPVPSLGAELRTQLKNESSQQGLRETSRAQGGQAGGMSSDKKETLRSSFSLIPDPPRPVDG